MGYACRTTDGAVARDMSLLLATTEGGKEPEEAKRHLNTGSCELRQVLNRHREIDDAPSVNLSNR